jgi:hypothetical protein
MSALERYAAARMDAPSPLVGEGITADGRERGRVRGTLSAVPVRRQPLTRLRFAPAPSPTRGEGKSPVTHSRRPATSPRKRGEVRAAPPSFHLSPRAGRGRIALAIRVRGSFRKRAGNGFENACHITQHVIVPETQDSIVVVSKPLVASRIARVVCVLPSVHSNDEATSPADKIDRVRTDRLLPNELVAVQSARPKPIPKDRLGIGRVSPQAPGAPGFHFVGSVHAATPPHPARFARRPLPASGERLAPPEPA